MSWDIELSSMDEMRHHSNASGSAIIKCKAFHNIHDWKHWKHALHFFPRDFFRKPISYSVCHYVSLSLFCRPNNEIPNDNWQMSGYFAKASKVVVFFLDWKGFPQKSPRIDYTSFFRDFKGSKGLRSGVDNTMWIWLLPKVIRRRRSSGHLEPLLSPKYASLKLSISGFRQSFLICFTLQKPLWHF